MIETVEFEFSIDALSPETLSMARLADYLKELAGLMGKGIALMFKGRFPNNMRVVCSCLQKQAGANRKNVCDGDW